MQNYVNTSELMCRRVLGNALRDTRCGRYGYRLGLATPALVGVFIYVAVVASQIAPAVDFEHELSKGQNMLHQAPSRCDCERALRSTS